MKKFVSLLIVALPFLCLGQSYYYDFNTDGDPEDFQQGGIPGFDVSNGVLVASDFTGGFQQIRSPEGLNLVEGDYTIVRIVAENLLTSTDGNHETFRIVNYDIGSNNAGAGEQSSNLTIPYGEGFATYDFAIPANSDNNGILDRIGLRIQLANGSGLSGTLKIDQLIIVNTLSVNIASNGDFENNGGELAPWTANGADVSASLTTGNGGGNAGRLTFNQDATENNTLRNSFYTFAVNEFEQVDQVTVSFDAKSNNTSTSVGIQLSYSNDGGVEGSEFNGNESLTTSWSSYSFNKSIDDDFDEIRVDLRIKTNVATAVAGDIFDFDNVVVLVDYYNLSPPGPELITSIQDGNWNDTAIWSSGVLPTDVDDVLIEHALTLNDDQVANNVTITTGNSLAINKGSSLTVGGDLVTDTSVNTSVVMRCDADEFSSLIVDGISTGDIRFRRYVNEHQVSGGNDLISPPVAIASFNDFYTDNLSYFVEDTDSDAVLFGPFDNSALVNAYINFESTSVTALVQGKGYRMGTNGTLAETSALNFHGPVETGPINMALTNPDGGSPWNLIGNPYTSYISFKDFFDAVVDFDGTHVGTNNQLDPDFTAVYGYDADNTDSTGSVWTIWDFNNTNYATDKITPGQGFFVRSKTGGGTVAFTPNMRTIGGADDFILGRSSNSNVAKIGLLLSDANNVFTTNLFFRDHNTVGLEPGFDTGAYNQEALGIFTHLVAQNNGVLMANQSLPFEGLNNMQIPLVVKSGQGVQISFSLGDITELPDTVSVYLDDNVANTSTLLNDSDYTITPNVTLDGAGRFYLRLANSQLSTAQNELADLTVFTSNTSIVVKGNLTETTTMNLFDVQGRLVNIFTLTTGIKERTIDVSYLSKGIYIVRLQNQLQSLAQKIILDK